MHSKTAKLGHSSWTRKILTNASALQRSEFHDPDQHRKQMVYYLYWNIWPWKRFHKDLLTTSSFLYLHHYLHHSLPKSNQLLPVTHFPNSDILCLTDGKVGTGNAMYSPLSKLGSRIETFYITSAPTWFNDTRKEETTKRPHRDVPNTNWQRIYWQWVWQWEFLQS